MGTLSSTYVDGRHARVHVVELAIHDGAVNVSGDSLDRCVPIEAVEITDAIGSAPRLVRFSDGACCEPIDQQSFASLLAAQGIGRSRLSIWERSPVWIAGSLCALVLVLALAYRWGLPAAARVIAHRMPDAAVAQLSQHVLAVLDRTLFEPSNLPGSRQLEVVRAFEQLDLPAAGGGRRHQIEFRRADRIGANAMALPSGIIVVSDALVTLAKDDREILAVLAHEAGHVAGRHGLRQMLQGSAIALFITWFLGDMSAVAAVAPTALLQAHYSRDLERDADDYAADVLRRNGMSTAYLATMLERLEAAHGGGTPRERMMDYLSTHPATAERLERLRTR